MDKNGIIEFLKKNELGVVATADVSGKPEAAVMALVVKEDGAILMSTENTTRKFKNLSENDKVSVVIGGFKNDPTVQLDGICRILEGSEAQDAKSFMLLKQPNLKDYFESLESRFLEIKPNWMRYSDFSKGTPEIVELEGF